MVKHKKSNLIFLTGMLLILFSCVEQVQKTITYPEASDPNPDTLANWSSVPQGLEASFVGPLVGFPKSAIPNVESSQSCELAGWKGERVYSQMILWSADSIENIEFEFSEFESQSEYKIPANSCYDFYPKRSLESFSVLFLLYLNRKERIRSRNKWVMII